MVYLFTKHSPFKKVWLWDIVAVLNRPSSLISETIPAVFGLWMCACVDIQYSQVMQTTDTLCVHRLTLQTHKGCFRCNYSWKIASIFSGLILTFFSLSFCLRFTSLPYPPCAESFQWKPPTEKYRPAADKASDFISRVDISKPILWFFFLFFKDCISSFLISFSPPPSLCFPICWAKIKTRSRHVVVCSAVARVQRKCSAWCLCF